MKTDNFVKNTFGPHTVTLLDSDTCPSGQYKPRLASLLLLPYSGPAAAVVATRCYSDCNKAFKMDNCGYFACSADGLSCATTIAEMTLDTLSGAA
jgi:hypothetical protein